MTGLPIVRAGREIDPQLLRSRELGFLNGHVPVTGILSAIAVMAAVLDGRDAVVMSNEWSASIPRWRSTAGRSTTSTPRARLSKRRSGRCWRGARRPAELLLCAAAILRTVGGPAVRRVAQYHGTFRSCNRAFHLDKSLAAGPLVWPLR